MASPLIERAAPGLHDAVSVVLRDLNQTPGRACDLGCGSGAWAQRLLVCGYEVTACDLDETQYRGDAHFVKTDLNDPRFAHELVGDFGLITALEVIEHLESPIGFLRSVRELLAADGIAILTTPNVESLPAILKLLIKGKLRLFDVEHDDPTHISPIFLDLMKKQYLPLAGMRLTKHLTHPVDGFAVGRPAYQHVLNLSGDVLRKLNLVGDNHIFVLARE